MMNRFPRVVIAGTHSGCGKTTVATGLMAALVARGLQVQPFKAGPDFIDPTHHTKICGRTSRNLDPFMMGEDGVRDTFVRACRGADIAVIEGVMGMYDGVDGTGSSSTAHIASLLDAPVLLVIDAGGMSRSAQALIHGFSTYQKDLRIAGVIFNRIGSNRHRQMIESSLNLPALGWIPKNDRLFVRSRHLGLEMAHETSLMAEFGTVIEEYCDTGGIMKIAREAPQLEDDIPDPVERKPMVTVGIAWDPAFCFYYQDNIDRLRLAGAELVFFSPMSDRLPEIDGLYIGGGYPELHLEALSLSKCRAGISRAADAGMPIFGECGGLMYLTTEVSADRTYRLCGVLPATTEMTRRVQALGYVEGQSAQSTPCFPSRLSIRGHEFHYSRVIPAPDATFAFTLQRGKGIENGKDGLVQDHATGTFTHIYFSDDFVRNFIRCCAGRKK